MPEYHIIFRKCSKVDKLEEAIYRVPLGAGILEVPFSEECYGRKQENVLQLINRSVWGYP